MIHRRSQTRHAAPDLGRAEHWSDLALCKNDTDPERWFPTSQREEALVLPELQAFCAPCPVRDECLMAALSRRSQDDDGIRAGTTPTARRALRRRSARKHPRKAS